MMAGQAWFMRYFGDFGSSCSSLFWLPDSSLLYCGGTDRTCKRIPRKPNHELCGRQVKYAKASFSLVRNLMKINVIDGSNYFKGLLLLIRKDRNIAESEIQLMKGIGKTLGFEREFCNNAIHEILENKHIVDVTPKFSTKDLAIKFIKDGLALAFSDNEFHPSEEDWLGRQLRRMVWT
jgi:hypothetical protein